MEWQETVMEQEDIHKKCFGNRMPWSAGEAHSLAEAQAEITWPIAEKAGKKEVVDWLYDECTCPTRSKKEWKGLRIDCWKCRLKLKEWGIKEE